jgi:hypothetical protein
LDRPQCPLFRRGEGRIDEGLTEIDFAAVAEIFGKALEQPIEPAAPLPLLKAAVARLVGWIPRRQVMPGRARPQDPENAVQYGTRVAERSPPSIRTAAWPEEWFKHGPLRVGEVHAVEYDGHRSRVTKPIRRF